MSRRGSVRAVALAAVLLTASAATSQVAPQPVAGAAGPASATSQVAPQPVAGAAGPASATPQPRFPGVGRPATPDEIRAWDIDVRPDFTGLPKGSGSVAKGQEVWDAKCASCHGTFGESNQVFAPIVGGTTAEDITRGRVAALTRPGEQRTTLMKLSTVSTLWDYVNRAMPWTAPKTLTTEEVYAVVAYMLHLGEIVPDDFVLSDRNIADVQRRLPNRDGMTRAHGLWDVAGTPDVKNTACMSSCPAEGAIASRLPEHARNSHGNLADQHRLIGPVRGVDTTRPSLTGQPGEAARELARRTPVPDRAGRVQADGLVLATRHACVACHTLEQRLVGPSFREISARYRDVPDAARALVGRTRAGGSGTWGPTPMPPQAHVAPADVETIVRWILTEVK
jgi:cytochrome c